MKSIFLRALVLFAFISNLWALQAAPLQMETGVVNATSSFQSVAFKKSYTAPVVFINPALVDTRAINPRIRVNQGNFEIILTRADKTATFTIPTTTVHYLVVESGSHSINGVQLDVQKFISTQADIDNPVGRIITPAVAMADAICISTIQSSEDLEYQSLVSIRQDGVLRLRRLVSGVSNVRQNETVGVLFMSKDQPFAFSGNVFEALRADGIRDVTTGGTISPLPVRTYTGAQVTPSSLAGDPYFMALSGANAIGGANLRLASFEPNAQQSHAPESADIISVGRSIPQVKIGTAPVMVFPSTGGNVAMSSLGSTIRFTNNGTNPSTSSPAYTSPLAFTSGTVTLRAMATLAGYGNSAISEAVAHVSALNEAVLPGVIHTTLHWPYKSNSESYNTITHIPDLSNTAVKAVRVIGGLGIQVLPELTVQRYESHLFIRTAGLYTFHINKNQTSTQRLKIDGQTILEMSVLGALDGQAGIQLSQGLHMLMVEAIDNTFDGNSTLFWSCPAIGLAKSYIPAQNMFYLPSRLAQIKTSVDTDADFLSDLSEKNIYHTNQFQADSDFDGLDDATELSLGTGFNPNMRFSFNSQLEDGLVHALVGSGGNLLGNLRTQQTLHGASYKSATGKWRKTTDGAIAINYRGQLEFDIALPADDLHLLKVSGQAYGLMPNSPARGYDLALWCDGQYVGRRTLESSSTYKEDNAMKYFGGLRIDAAGSYRFYASSQTGVEVYLDGQLVVDNDSVKASVVEVSSAAIPLSAGVHTISVHTFGKAGIEPFLGVQWSGPRLAKQAIPDSALQSLKFAYVEGVYTQVPDFMQLTPVKSGSCANFDLEMRKSPREGSVVFVLPWLKGGMHKLSLLFDNGRFSSTLQVNQLSVMAIDGPDLDNDGRKDWVTKKLSNSSVMQITSSKTSPCFVEGTGDFVEAMSISGASAQPGASQRWFSNVPLNETQATPVNVIFQNGAKSVARTISWAKTNLFPQITPFKVRVNDALLLNPFPAGKTGTASLSVKGVTSSIAPGGYLKVAFDTAGDYEIIASFRETGSSVTSTATTVVTAVGLTLPNTTQVGLVGTERRMLLPEVPSIVYQNDERLLAWYKTGVTASGQSELAIALDEKEHRTIVARLGDNGPVLATLDMLGMEAYGAGQTWLKPKENLPDGSQILSMGVVAWPLPADVDIQLDLFLPGILFIDGSTQAVLDSTDFSDINISALDILKSKNAKKTACCHHLTVKQGNSLVGLVY